MSIAGTPGTIPHIQSCCRGSMLGVRLACRPVTRPMGAAAAAQVGSGASLIVAVSALLSAHVGSIMTLSAALTRSDPLGPPSKAFDTACCGKLLV